MSRRPVTATLPTQIAQQFTDIVTRTQRSPAFIALRALNAAGDKTAPGELPRDEGHVPVELRGDDDDPPGVQTKLAALAKRRPLGEALSAAWRLTYPRFQRWAVQEQAAREAERADDLDAGLAEAQTPTTPAPRLQALAGSPYARIRALVAVHPGTPADVLARLARDREPYVRDAVTNRPLRG